MAGRVAAGHGAPRGLAGALGRRLARLPAPGGARGGAPAGPAGPVGGRGSFAAPGAGAGAGVSGPEGGPEGLAGGPGAGAAPAAAGGGGVRERLVLIDGMAMAYRAHFGAAAKWGGAAPPREEGGLGTSAVFAFVGSVLTVLEMRPAATHVAAVFDAPGKTFRHVLLPTYKAHRPPMPEELRQGIPRMRALLRAMNVAVVEVPGVEADDAIGTLVARGVQEGLDVDIISPDKDFLQLLGPRVRALRPAPRGTGHGLVVWDEARLLEETGLSPAQYVDMQALAGDHADGYPGVKGIGPVWAQRLIKEFGTLEGVLENAEHVQRKSVREALLGPGGAESARLGQRLARIRTDLSAPVLRKPGQKYRFSAPPDGGEALLSTFHSLNFEAGVQRVHSLWGAR